MSKICPNCGVNSPDNVKFCIECGSDLEDVPISKEETTPKQTSKININLKQRHIIFIAIITIAIIATGFFISGLGGNNISITFDKVYVEANNYTSGMKYTYCVSGYINNFPDDEENYIIRTILYDANGTELTSITKKLSLFNRFSDQSFTFFYESTENYMNVDHVSVQIIKDNNVLNEFNSTITKKIN